MNMTVVGSFFFISFALCMCAAAWIARYSLLGSALILACSIMFFGSVKIRNEDGARCPKCGHEFIVKMKDNSEELQKQKRPGAQNTRP